LADLPDVTAFCIVDAAVLPYLHSDLSSQTPVDSTIRLARSCLTMKLIVVINLLSLDTDSVTSSNLMTL